MKSSNSDGNTPRDDEEQPKKHTGNNKKGKKKKGLTPDLHETLAQAAVQSITVWSGDWVPTTGAVVTFHFFPDAPANRSTSNSKARRTGGRKASASTQNDASEMVAQDEPPSDDTEVGDQIRDPADAPVMNDPPAEEVPVQDDAPEVAQDEPPLDDAEVGDQIDEPADAPVQDEPSLDDTQVGDEVDEPGDPSVPGDPPIDPATPLCVAQDDAVGGCVAQDDAVGGCVAQDAKVEDYPAQDDPVEQYCVQDDETADVASEPSSDSGRPKFPFKMNSDPVPSGLRALMVPFDSIEFTDELNTPTKRVNVTPRPNPHTVADPAPIVEAAPNPNPAVIPRRGLVLDALQDDPVENTTRHALIPEVLAEPVLTQVRPAQITAVTITPPLAVPNTVPSAVLPHTSRPLETPIARRVAPARRFSGLDGLRALAVVAVLCYHGMPGLPNAGFLGVDVFFVLSGFLITSLILDEFQRGRFSVWRFWDRRLRRIVPAVVVMLIGISSIVLWLDRDLLYAFRRQVLGALTFSYNWLDIASSSSYFSEFQPEMFRNLWSLAIEMQFYLIWPLLLVPMLHWRRKSWAVTITLLAAVASVALMAWRFVGYQDPTRVYFGTDTHAFGLLIGASLACLVSGRSNWRMRDAKVVHPHINRVLGVLGVGSIVGLVVFIVLLDDSQAFVYPGGLLAASGLAGIAVIAASAEGSWFGRVLDVRPLRWLGQRSYGVYLWHWPLGIVVSALVPAAWLSGSSHINDVLTMLASLVLSICAAAASYRWVETPIRRGGWLALVPGHQRRSEPDFQIVRVTRSTDELTPFVWHRTGGILRLCHGVAWLAALLAFASLAACLYFAPAKTETQELIEQGQQTIQRMQSSPTTPPSSSAVPTTDPSTSDPPITTTPTSPPLPMPTGDEILAVGDSIMLGCADDLDTQYPGILVDAQVSRSLSAGLDLLQQMSNDKQLRPVLLVGLFTNGLASNNQLERLLAIAGPDTTIVLVTGHAPRPWIAPTNDAVYRFADAHPDNVLVADWDAAIGQHPEWLASDGVHPKPEGRALYVQIILQALQVKFSG